MDERQGSARRPAPNPETAVAVPVVFDNSFLAALYGPFQNPPVDPSTGKPVERAHERVEYLLEKLSNAQVKILIPAPALSEFLCVAGRSGTELIERLSASSRFKVEPFDTPAAIEAAQAISAALAKGDKRGGRVAATWQKVKFDRQIVAIAKTRGATQIYSDDDDIAAYGSAAGIEVISVAELDLPPPRQEGLPLEISVGEEGADEIAVAEPKRRRIDLPIETEVP